MRPRRRVEQKLYHDEELGPLMWIGSHDVPEQKSQVLLTFLMDPFHFPLFARTPGSAETLPDPD